MVEFTVEQTTTPTSAEQRAALMADPKFGRVFTDHMAVIRYKDGQGWYDAKIIPRQPLQIDPASTVLHYGQEIFEGLKAYRGKDGAVSLFRPEANAARFVASARRLSMAELPEELFLGAIKALLKVDRDWVPAEAEKSLYLRPFMISNEVFLGVKRANEYLFIVLASPVGGYFSGNGSIPVWVSEHYTRAAIGGTGEAKCGGNYASSLLPQQEASDNGCSQVLFLDAKERRFIDEMGGMNVMFVRKDGSVVTPPLGGTILRGITRDSILKLGRHMGLTMVEEPLAIEDVFKAAATGDITEAFACGTAAVISPIGEFRRKAGSVAFGDGKTAGPVTMKLRNALCGLQRGEEADPFGWVHPVAL
ncbi:MULTISPECIES: branched-chain amino acid aminotransferase [Bombella]|uniref:Probable branched-chain-amino-acid aminotransferase n=1 Tax=Bombella saccharophila TaxID=2967338 RepID=A0ABT3W973_9PROT|nr:MULTISPECIES: branched-chain amino acid aminotransferase [Bombella]MCX5614865.1 branched-chain amino acid aminotransferase [Bombella saccharophila]MUG05241.1 branched-chain amino acid aminotransferase [Bombella sp. ESL0378]MUG90788.1 branched-chain amino acid aminotransferase [Bombella sp. ESL0385]